MAKKENLIFKVIALGGFIVGTVAIAQAVNTRLRRMKDEEEIEEIVTEVEENFSGMINRRRGNIASRFKSGGRKGGATRGITCDNNTHRCPKGEKCNYGKCVPESTWKPPTASRPRGGKGVKNIVSDASVGTVQPTSDTSVGTVGTVSRKIKRGGQPISPNRPTRGMRRTSIDSLFGRGGSGYIPQDTGDYCECKDDNGKVTGWGRKTRKGNCMPCGAIRPVFSTN